MEDIVVSKGIYYESNLEHLNEVFDTYVTDKKFLDLGSGKGYVAQHAMNYTNDATGIEVEQFLYDVSAVQNNITNDDFFDTDFSEYDVIYYYLLGSDEETRLIEKLESELNGTVIFYHWDIPFPEYIEEFYDKITELTLVEEFDHGKIYQK